MFSTILSIIYLYQIQIKKNISIYIHIVTTIISKIKNKSKTFYDKIVLKTIITKYKHARRDCNAVSAYIKITVETEPLIFFLLFLVAY